MPLRPLAKTSKEAGVARARTPRWEYTGGIREPGGAPVLHQPGWGEAERETVREVTRGQPAEGWVSITGPGFSPREMGTPGGF